jgi:flagellum-specific peptidoglycan hydrolase FlgJ
LNQAYLKAGVTNENLRKALVAQSALESGWGARSLGGGDYNYGNITLGSAKNRNYRIAWDHNAKGENVQ